MIKDLSKYKEIIIWGACFPPDVGGQSGSHGYASERLYKLLDDNGYSNKIVMWVDSNVKLHGKMRFGKIVCSPLELLNHKEALLIINSVSMQTIIRNAKSIGATNDILIIPCYFYNGTIGHPYDNDVARSVVVQYGKEIKEMFSLEDEETLRYLNIIFEQRIKCDDDLYSEEYYKDTGEYMNYFCDSTITPKGNVTFVDVGAYEGDSIEPIRQFYGERLKSCIAFEPNMESYKKLKNYVKKTGISKLCKTYQFALGNENKLIHFTQTGVTSLQLDDGEEVLEQKVFDEINLDNVIIGDVMVKMDIEGAEEYALRGMEKFIRKYKPYLAICIYHKEDDIYRLPKLIKSFYSGYKLYIRGGWHLECWAVPENKMEID